MWIDGETAVSLTPPRPPPVVQISGGDDGTAGSLPWGRRRCGLRRARGPDRRRAARLAPRPGPRAAGSCARPRRPIRTAGAPRSGSAPRGSASARRPRAPASSAALACPRCAPNSAVRHAFCSRCSRCSCSTSSASAAWSAALGPDIHPHPPAPMRACDGSFSGRAGVWGGSGSPGSSAPQAPLSPSWALLFVKKWPFGSVAATSHSPTGARPPPLSPAASAAASYGRWSPASRLPPRAAAVLQVRDAVLRLMLHRAQLTYLCVLYSEARWPCSRRPG